MKGTYYKMSLNNIVLKPFLLADLYPNTLIETAATTVPEKKQVKLLGNNAKKIIVIVNHEQSAFLPDHELNFLTTILNACKLSLADIGIVNLQQSGDQVEQVIESDGRVILLFGIEPSSICLPVHFPPFQVQPFSQRTYMHAPSLDVIEKDKQLKGQLWASLKQIFGL